MGRFLFRAQDLNMTNGDYVFYTDPTATLADDRQPWLSFNLTGQNMTYRTEAFYAMKEVIKACRVMMNKSDAAY